MEVTLALVGLGGYGMVYLEGLLDRPRHRNFRIIAGVDPEPDRCRRLPELEAMRVPILRSMKEFYSQNTADLVILSSPIHLHCPQTCYALEAGSNVLCEKPLGATIQEAAKMIEFRDRARKIVAIGYQWSFSDSIQNLKRDVQRGLFGSPKRLKTIALWPRDKTYYTRNNWAGKMRDKNGNWVLDSPANNALAHYLHNMFYILGDKADCSASPEWVEAELYRAHPIENYDTFAMRCLTDANVEILFYGSHATARKIGPIISYEFETATITYNGLNSDMVAHFNDGTEKNYGPPDRDQIKKMWDTIAAIRTNEKVVCGIEAASSQTLCINGMQESMPEIVNFPRHLILKSDSRNIYVKSLEEDLMSCYDRCLLPHEAGFPWSQRGRGIGLKNYSRFPAGE